MSRNKAILLMVVMLLCSLSFLCACSDLKITDEGKEPQESDAALGSKATDNGAPLPAELFGTWSATAGLPPELSSYSITINADGSVQDTSVDTSGTSSTNSGRCVSTDQGYAIVNDDGITVMTVRLENSQLISDNLSSEPVTFSKVA